MSNLIQYFPLSVRQQQLKRKLGVCANQISFTVRPTLIKYRCSMGYLQSHRFSMKDYIALDYHENS